MGGASAPSGELAMVRTRDLGILNMRRDPALRYRVKNWLTKRWKEDAAYASRCMLGKVVTNVRFESRMIL
jgi:hypothetical protein